MANAAKAAVTYILVVIHPFGTYRRGDMIKDPGAIATVVAGPNAHYCNRVAAK